VIWTNTVPSYSVDNKLGYGEIVVPTFDSIRMKYLKKILIMNKKHVLAPGPTGTGKTVNINQLLTAELNDDYQTIPLTFSAQTSAN
jgi:dynein heavy chain